MKYEVDFELPNQVAIDHSNHFLDMVRQSELIPTSVVSIPDGGISVAFLYKPNSALVEFYNTGEITFAVSSGLGTTTCEEEKNISLILDKIKNHLRI